MNNKNLCCCGNCDYFQNNACPLYEKVDEETYDYPEPREVCDNWTYDGQTYKERMQNI
jgi:hypothetical protein